MSNFLRYGDIVYLEFNERNILFCSSIYNPTLYAVPKTNIAFKSFRNGLFQIYPNFSYKDSNKIESLSKQLDLLKELNPQDQSAYLELKKDIENERSILTLRQAKLDVLNKKIYDESYGKPVGFGQKIQLLHIETNWFVTILSSTLEYDRALNKSTLTDSESRNLYFQFEPAISTGVSSEFVEYGPNVLLVSSNSQQQMCIGKDSLKQDQIFKDFERPSQAIINQGKILPKIFPRKREPILEFEEFYSAGFSVSGSDTAKVIKFAGFDEIEEVIEKNIIGNGDFIRIQNGYSYLTVYQNEENTLNEEYAYFQEFQNSEEVNFNYLYTLFQIIKVPDTNIQLPTYFKLHFEGEDSKKYLLRHYESGKFLVLSQDEKLILEDKNTIASIEFLKIIKETYQLDVSNNSILRLRFVNKSKNNYFLKSGNLITKKAAQVKDKSQYIGYQIYDEYLSKILRPIRYSVSLNPKGDQNIDHFFKFSNISPSERRSLLLVETFSNQLEFYYNFLLNFISIESYTIKEFNKRTLNILSICKKFHDKLFEDDSNQDKQSQAQEPNFIRQTLLREFRTHNFIYMILSILTVETGLTEKLESKDKKMKKAKKSKSKKADQDEQEKKEEFEFLSSLDDDFDFRSLVQIVKIFDQIISTSFIKNELNHIYTLPFVRITLEALLQCDEGIISKADYRTKIKFKEILLDIAKKALYDEDLDSLSQINEYRQIIFNSISQQKSYHSIYIKLVSHMANSSAPNLDNVIKNDFITNYLASKNNMSHVFPRIEEENGEICIKFTRGKSASKNVLLRDLNEDIILTPETPDDLFELFQLTQYFGESLNLLIAFRAHASVSLDYKVVQHYNYDILTKAIESSQNLGQIDDIRMALTEVRDLFYLKFFTLSFTKFPSQIQIVDMNSEIKETYDQIQKAIEAKVKNCVSETELSLSRELGIYKVVELCQEQTFNKDVEKELIDSLNKKIPEQGQADGSKFITEVSLLLKNIQKYLASTREIEVKFLRAAHSSLLSWVEIATKKINDLKNKDDMSKKDLDVNSYINTIHEILQVFSLVEDKILQVAAIEIIKVLDFEKILNAQSSAEEAANHTNDKFSKKLHPLTEEWKKRKPLYKVDSKAEKIEQKYKHYTEEGITKCVLKVFLLKNNMLTQEAIAQLNRITSFENSLIAEMMNTIIVNDNDTLKKAGEILLITYDLNLIAREKSVQEDHKIPVDGFKAQAILKEVLKNCWTILLNVYQIEKHFSVTQTDSEEKFREFFAKYKLKADLPFKFNPEAICKPLQKLLHVAETHRSLLRTFNWVIKELSYDYEICLSIIKLIDIILMIFVYHSKLAQEEMSNLASFIKLIINDQFLNASSDSLGIFSEMMRDNNRLLVIPRKHLYEIILQNFILKLEEAPSNKSFEIKTIPLISSISFIIRSAIPKDVFTVAEVISKYWSEVIKTEECQDFKVQNSIGRTFESPTLYYVHQEIIDVISEAITFFSKDQNMQLEFSKMISDTNIYSLFISENHLLQYKFKNTLAKSVTNLYFKSKKKIALFHETEDFKEFVIGLLTEMIYFKKFEGQDDDIPSEFMQSDIVRSCSSFYRLSSNYSRIRNIDFQETKFQFYFDEVPLKNTQSEFIFNGCLNLVFGLIINYPEYSLKVLDPNTPLKNIFSIFLFVLEDFVKNFKSHIMFENKIVDDFLTQLILNKEYSDYRSKVTGIAHIISSKLKLHSKTIAIDSSYNLKKLLKPDSALASFNEFLAKLINTKENTKLKNVLLLSEGIAALNSDEEFPDGEHKLLGELIDYLLNNYQRLKSNQIKYMLRILHSTILRLNTLGKKTEDVTPIHEWDEVSSRNLKVIRKKQLFFYSKGLTKLVFELLKSEDSELLLEVLKLCIGYVYGGNAIIQQDFFNQFINDTENGVLMALSSKLESIWASVSSKENDRINELYLNTQRIIFEHLKDYKEMKDIKPNELQKAFKENISTKYLDNADESQNGQVLIHIMCFLQGLCEKQFTPMQNYLREQIWEGKKINPTYDFIGIMRSFFNAYAKNISSFNISIGTRLLNLIMEVLQGDVRKNITAILNKTFIYDLCKILTDYNSVHHLIPRGFGVDPFGDKLLKFKGLIITAIKLMLENQDEGNIETLKEHLDMIGLMKTLEKLMDSFLNTPNSKGKKRRDLSKISLFTYELCPADYLGSLGSAIDIYIIFRYIWPDHTEFRNNINEMLVKVHKDDNDSSKIKHYEKIIFLLFRKLVGNVELVIPDRNPSLVKIWFPLIAPCHFLQPEVKEQFLENVDRSNNQVKVAELMEGVHSFIPEMKTELSSQKRIFGLNTKVFYNLGRVFSGYLAITINLITLFTYFYKNQNDEEAFQDTDPTIATYAIQGIQIFFALMLILLWLLIYMKRYLNVSWQQFVQENLREEGEIPPSIIEKISETDDDKLLEAFANSKEDLLILMRRGGPNSSPEFQEVMNNSDLFKMIQPEFIWQNIYFLLRSGTLIWHLIYLGICIGSLFHDLVTVFQLYEIAIRSDTIRNIYTSIARNKRQFGWTLFLLAAVTLFYSTLGFYVYNDKLTLEDGESRKPLCSKNIQCLLNFLNIGLRPGGGIADVVEPVKYEEEVGRWIGKIVYDLTFFILIKILLLNLIFGMIIDGFGDLRDQKSSDEEDRKNICFMCGVERSEFEKIGNFDEHTQDEHYIWNYVFYITYIQDKFQTRPNDMTDIENNVFKRYMRGDEDWMPVGKQSLTLQKGVTETEQQETPIETVIADILAQHKEELIKQIKFMKKTNKIEEADSHVNVSSNDLKPGKLKQPSTVITGKL